MPQPGWKYLPDRSQRSQRRLLDPADLGGRGLEGDRDRHGLLVVEEQRRLQQTVLFPIMILSGMLLPLDGGPGWMQALAKANPLTYVVDAQRALFAGDLTSSAVLWGFVAAGVTAAIGLTVGIRSMRRSD